MQPFDRSSAPSTDRSASVLLITSDMAEMVTLADRILVLHDFRIVGEVASDHRYEGTSAAVMSFIHAVEPATAGA